MKLRVQRIEIQYFKAFREFSLNLEGRHLLLYGPGQQLACRRNANPRSMMFSLRLTPHVHPLEMHVC